MTGVTRSVVQINSTLSSTNVDAQFSASSRILRLLCMMGQSMSDECESKSEMTVS